MIQVVRGDLDRAEELLHIAIDNDPGLARAYYTLGMLYVGTERVDEAMGVFEQGLRVDPDHALTHYTVAILHMNYELSVLKGPAQHGDAADHWAEFLRLSEGDPALAEQRDTAVFYIRQYYPGLLD